MGESYGLIDQNDQKYYTYLSKVFKGLGDVQKQYNWLITDCEAYPQDMEAEAMLNEEYRWISGEDFSEMIEKEDFQWVWAVLAGFEKNIALEKVLKYPLPEVRDGGGTYCKNPISIQHPLAVIEIIPFDSAYTVILSRDKSIIDHYKTIYPKTQDLTDFNAQ